MNLEVELPAFITPLMTKWLAQYKMDVIKDITILGLFHWDFRSNKRKPEKPRRVLRLGESTKLNESVRSYGIYFLEVDDKTLHVFESSGPNLTGLKIAKEYIFEDNKFLEINTLLKYIS